MSFSNYPTDQDKAFESFIITNQIKQINNFGRTYSQSELLPLDYLKVTDAIVDGTLPYAFLREINRVGTYTTANFNDEASNLFQSIQLGDLLTELWNYYVDLINQHKIAMGVVTELKTTVQHIGGVNDIQLTTTAKVTWFAPDFCSYV